MKYGKYTRDEWLTQMQGMPSRFDRLWHVQWADGTDGAFADYNWETTGYTTNLGEAIRYRDTAAFAIERLRGWKPGCVIREMTHERRESECHDCV